MWRSHRDEGGIQVRGKEEAEAPPAVRGGVGGARERALLHVKHKN